MPADDSTGVPMAVGSVGPGRWRRVVAIGVVVLVLGALTWLWNGSRLASAYPVMSMGYADYGGGPTAAGHQHQGRSVATLVAATTRPADVHVVLTARKGRVTLADGRAVDGYSLNGATPGPTLRAVEGDLVEVRLVNESVQDGMTLHWHGLDVPNAEDGVAGVTQDAVMPGQEHTYRFVAGQIGTFWYHSHQVSHEQVRGGLLGAVVITPKIGLGAVVDVLALVHLYAGERTVNGRAGDVRVPAPAGAVARVRVINTDNGPMPVWVAGTAYRVLAVDGQDLHGPTPVKDASVLVTAGGRADLEVRVPDDGRAVRVDTGGASILVGPVSGTAAPVSAPSTSVDLLTYGTPAPLGFDPAAATRRFEYAIGRRPGLLDGRPGLFWTINGHLFPDVPTFVVAEGDIVRVHLTNTSGEVHPMHLHGHRLVVLARNGVASTGSPWVVDSLNVGNGESYDVAFVADNPGVWMDHCHNLPHATEGLVAHLVYAGVMDPYLVGGSTRNQPE